MLALTDSQLGMLAIGASRISPKKHGRWLKEIARKLDPPKSHKLLDSPPPTGARGSKIPREIPRSTCRKQMTPLTVRQPLRCYAGGSGAASTRIGQCRPSSRTCASVPPDPSASTALIAHISVWSGSRQTVTTRLSPAKGAAFSITATVVIRRRCVRDDLRARLQ